MPLFLHAADVHLDSPLHGLERYEGAPVDAIRGATRRAFEAMTDLAIEKKVAFVLLAGDLYDGDWKDYNTGLFFNQKMAQLSRADIPAFVISGNHDAQSAITRSLRPPSNTYVFPAEAPETVELKPWRVAIHGQSYATPAVREDLAAGYPNAVPGALNIGLLHTSLDGRPGHEPYAPCRIDTLRAKGYQYWALGHIHAREVVSTTPHIVYPGCIQGRHVRETGAKGCTLVSFEDGEISAVTHHPLDVLRWVECRVPVDGLQTEAEFIDPVRRALEAALAEAGGLPIAARIVFVGAAPLHTSLQSDPIRWENIVRSTATEIDDTRLWIEKICFRTSGQRTMETALADESPLSAILRSVAEFPTAIEHHDRLSDAIATLRAKLPHALFQGENGIDLDDPSVKEALVNTAKEHLLARLLSDVAEP